MFRHVLWSIASFDEFIVMFIFVSCDKANMEKLLRGPAFEKLEAAAELNAVVPTTLALPAPSLPPAGGLDEVFLYRVPESTDDGACAASEKIAAEPFDLGEV